MCLLSETLILEWVFSKDVRSSREFPCALAAKGLWYVPLWNVFQTFLTGPFDVYFPSNKIEFHGAAHRAASDAHPLAACLCNKHATDWLLHGSIWNIFIIMYIKCTSCSCARRETQSPFYISSGFAFRWLRGVMI
jgi:hypothetical protein